MLKDLGQIIYKETRCHVKQAAYSDGSPSLFLHTEGGQAAVEITKFHPGTKDLSEMTGSNVVALKSIKIFNLLRKNQLVKNKVATIGPLILATLQNKS